MRVGLVIVGVVLLVLGLVLAMVAIIPSNDTFSADCTSCNQTGVGYNVFSASPALFGGTVSTFSWSSNTTIDLFVITCSKAVTTSELSTATPSQENADCGTNATYGSATADGIQYSTGTSGSLAFTIPSGGTLLFFAFSDKGATVTTTLTYSQPIVGDILLIVGILVLILGVVLKSHKKKPVQQQPVYPGAPYQQGPPGQYPPQPWQQPPPGQWQQPPPQQWQPPQ